MNDEARVGIFGWGVVAPQCADVDVFERRLAEGDSWLEPFDGFGPDNFLVGQPQFELADYRGWIEERFPPTRFGQIQSKFGEPTHYAMGAFVQALGQNPGIEAVLQELGPLAHVYVGTGLGDLPTIYETSVRLDRAQARWNRFWAKPSNNSALAAGADAAGSDAVPADPAHCNDEWEREDLQRDWDAFWAARSPELARFLEELRQIEGVDVEGDVEAGKKGVLRRKRTAIARLQEKWGAPTPPWDDKKLANVIWNLHNTPASNISIVGRITGLSFAPIGACATFGVTLRLAMTAIRSGQAKAVVIGSADAAPHPLLVGAFYNGRIIAADGEVSRPLTGLRGTHVSGGAAIWIVADHDYMRERGFTPLGLEPVAVGVSSDADHIITPSVDGPLAAVGGALREGALSAEQLTTWDLHATATPGDYKEVENLLEVAPDSVLVSARKGTFGHGMGAAGGWELTAQYLGAARGELAPTPLSADALNAEIAKLHRNFVFDRACTFPGGIAGKLSMGVGGINSCVLSRRW
jgi:3-oxoacyl-(acyl-carrier-protein) synthase